MEENTNNVDNSSNMSTKPVDESSKVLDELKKIQRFQLILQGISACGILGLFIAAVISQHCGSKGL